MMIKAGEKDQELVSLTVLVTVLGFLFGKILFFILTEISPQRIGELCRVTTGGIKLIERLSSSSSFSPFSFFPLKENKHIQSRY